MFIRYALPRDRAKIGDLVEAAFGRHDEALLVESLREDGKIVTELVATQLDEPVGHLVLSKLRKPKHCLALAPVSVAPDHQKEGIGSALIHAALEQAEDDGWAAVFVLGDPTYYNRFGFDVGQAAAFESPYPPEFTGVAVLDPGAFSVLAREIQYPKAFSML